jgi:segregation and condensation protein B
VGGQPLTAKRLCSVLKREFDQAYVERRIDELNALYTTECRPYEIVLGEGGFRLQLQPEFTALRDRVFGLGPREIKLSQDALEVLSFIGYRQPISERELADAGKPKVGALIRQLLRRDLIVLQRGDSPADVKYKTSARFLELFGLGSIDELPTTEDFEFK